MTENTEPVTEAAVEQSVAEAPVSEPSAAPEPDTPEAADTFDRAYVAKLRAEAAEARVKAKARVDDANGRLVAAYAASTGRLIEPDALAYSDDLLGEDGFVDPARVAEAVEALIADRPHLARRTPSTRLPQGAQGEIREAPSLFAIARAQM